MKANKSIWKRLFKCCEIVGFIMAIYCFGKILLFVLISSMMFWTFIISLPEYSYLIDPIGRMIQALSVYFIIALLVGLYIAIKYIYLEIKKYDKKRKLK